MEDKTGKIVSVENATEKQKNQKLGLKLKIAALCTAIGISGVGIFSLNQEQPDKSNQISSVPTWSDEELSLITKMETNLKDYTHSAEESDQKQIINDISVFLNDVINTSDDSKSDTETVTLNRDEMLQALVDSGLTLEEANKQLLAAEEKAANEQGVHTELEYNEMMSAIDRGISIEEQRELAAEQLANYNDYLSSNQVKTNNRELLLQALVDSGLTLEEANKQLLAAEEKAANEQGVHTELEYNEMMSAIDQGISIEEQRELAAQQLSNYNDYERLIQEQSEGKVR